MKAFKNPVLRLSGIPELLTNVPLYANAVFGADRIVNRYDDVLIDRVRSIALANQDGALYIDEAQNEGGPWTTIKTVAVVAGVPADTGWVKLTAGRVYHRTRFVNGATPQTAFRLYEAVDVDDKDVTVTGSIPATRLTQVPETGNMTFTTTPATVKVGAQRLSGRSYILVKNTFSVRMRFGKAGQVSTTAGTICEPGDEYFRPIDPAQDIDILGCVESGSGTAPVEEGK